MADTEVEVSLPISGRPMGENLENLSGSVELWRFLYEILMELSPQEHRSRSIGLSIVLAPIAASFLYNQGWRLPWLNGCPLQRHIGIPCPGWGLTRSFMAMARGDWQQAIDYHLFGPLLFLVLVVIAITLSIELIGNRKGRSIGLLVKAVRNPKWILFLLLLLWGYHATRLFALGKSGELYTLFRHSSLGQWLY